MEFCRQEYWGRLPFPSPENLPNLGVEPWFPTLQTESLPSEPPGKPLLDAKYLANKHTMGNGAAWPQACLKRMIKMTSSLISLKYLVGVLLAADYVVVVVVLKKKKKTFSNCWRAGLVVLNSLSFCLSVKLFISPSYLNEILAG